MAPNDPWKRYLDAGLELTALTRQRAEKVVRDLMKAGEVQRDEVQERVDELLERSRRTTDAVVDMVRDEVAKQLNALGITSSKPSGGAGSAPSASTAASPSKSATTTKSAAAKKNAPGSAKSAKKTASKAQSAPKKASGAS